MELYPLKEVTNKIKDGYPDEFDIVVHQGEFKIGTMREDDNFSQFITVDISNYTMDSLDDFALSQFISLATPKKVAELINEIESLQKRVDELEK